MIWWLGKVLHLVWYDIVMKNYKPKQNKKGKLLQIRLSEREHKDITDFIKKFEVTHREWLLTVLNHLRPTTLIKDNTFWINWKEYSYANSDKWDKKITDDSECEECGTIFDKSSDYDNRGTKQLERHHYLGYEGENAFKVQILCRPCHWKKSKSIIK